MANFLETIRHEFQRHKKLADAALAQLEDKGSGNPPGNLFFAMPFPAANSPAAIVKHMAGNLKSRWTDFLTTDGDKPDRDRDGEFVIGPNDSQAQLMSSWEGAWATLLETLTNLQPGHLDQTIVIRGEPHTVLEALIRGLTHAAYHTGQITYLTRALNKDGAWLTIPPGQSKSQRGSYLGKDTRGSI